LRITGRGSERNLSGAAAPWARDEIEALAVRLERSCVRLLTQALVGSIDQAQGRRKLMLEALADIDSDRLVAHEAVQAWPRASTPTLPYPSPAPIGAEKAQWTSKALQDLTRLYDFLAPLNRKAAAVSAQASAAVPLVLVGSPRLGDKLEEFARSDVRGIPVSSDEMRPAITDETSVVPGLGTRRRINRLEAECPLPLAVFCAYASVL